MRARARRAERPGHRVGRWRAGGYGGVVVMAAALLVAGAPSTAGAAAQSPQVRIQQVGGNDVVRGQAPGAFSGEVEVSGTATTSGSGTASTRPLVADAGDSGFVAVGKTTTLRGMGFGGAAPYTFEWSASQGTLKDADQATARFDTTDLQPGTYTVRLTVTDRLGDSATDTVKVIVHDVTRETLLDADFVAQNPGGIVVGWSVEKTFVVREHPGKSTTLSAKLTFDGQTNRYRFQLLDPNDEVAATRETQPGEQVEIRVSDPQLGEWTASVVQWEPPEPKTSHVTVVTESVPGDPRPEVSAGGPYSYTPNQEQQLSGTVSGGTAPVTKVWDLDGDGNFGDASGVSPTVDLPEGRHLITLKATDANGLERRETSSLLVADPDVIATNTSPVTVIGVPDTGINAYHQEFSAATYPDPAILALTDNFTRHPSEYIPGYPKDAASIPITSGQGYFPAADKPLWTADRIKTGELYWIPGTKIIGAVDTGASSGVTSGGDPHPILDDNGHGSGSASVSAGNRYGYCPTCLLVAVEGLDATVATQFPWVDITTHSFGYVGGAPVGPIASEEEVTKAAVERGQTVLFAAGNGVGNAFDVPIVTWHSDLTGPDWNITVGATRRDNQRAIVGDGIPVHLSAWGDGNLPSACRTGAVGQCAFSGTSASTPYTAGVFGTVLTQVRAAVGDGAAGQKPGQVVAKGIPREGSVYLADGELTRAELREAVLKTAFPLNQDNQASPFPYPLTAPYTGEPNVLFEGYGAATPESARRAVDVLLGREPLPERPFEDDFFALDRAVRDTFWGGYDRDGDGSSDFRGVAEGLGVTAGQVTTVTDALRVLRRAASLRQPDVGLRALGENSLTYWLHRRVADAPDAPEACTAALPESELPDSESAGNEQYMDRNNSDGDLEPCFENRITSVLAAYRPLGIFASADVLDAPLPTGSTVNVELYIAGETPSMIRPTGVLVATDREVGTGEGLFAPVAGSGPSGAGCEALGEACWTRYAFSFDITRPAFTGEQLTFQVQLLGARSWAFGHEGAHASKIAIEPAELPETGLEFGASITSPADGSSVSESETVIAGGRYDFPDLGSDPTGAGDHPTTRKVEVSVDDASFADPLVAVLDEQSKTWSVKVGTLPAGDHNIYARARIDQTVSEVTTSRFTVRPDTEVQWQIVDRNAAASADGWRAASGTSRWSFTFDTADYQSKGPKTVVVRLVHHGLEVARDTVRIRTR